MVKIKVSDERKLVANVSKNLERDSFGRRNDMHLGASWNALLNYWEFKRALYPHNGTKSEVINERT